MILAPPSSLAGMNNITIYDIDSNTFYIQQAIGVNSLARYDFCSVGAGSYDNSSYEM